MREGATAAGSGAVGSPVGAEERDARAAALAAGERARIYELGRADGRAPVSGGAPSPRLSQVFDSRVPGGRRAYVFGFRDGREERGVRLRGGPGVSPVALACGGG